ncbi:hypothetical protein LIP37_12275, partial [Anaerosalibacter bizertensis]|nr:hypothetical protein [Anaerosalibacter bizertensis]
VLYLLYNSPKQALYICLPILNLLSNISSCHFSVLTLELKTEKWQEDILDKRFNIGRQIYNACLGELYKRYNTITQRKEYNKVLEMPKDKDRNKEFNKLNKKYGLTEYSLHKYVKP